MKVIAQRLSWDCGVASIAMLLDIPYNDVRDVVNERIDDPLLKKRGLILRQVEEVLGYFKFKSKRVYAKEGYLDGATGILGLLGGTMDKCGHWVVIKDGMILDPSDGAAHTPEEYMAENKCRACTMVVLD